MVSHMNTRKKIGLGPRSLPRVGGSKNWEIDRAPSPVSF